MKNVIIIALLAITPFTFAQTNQVKYGPKAKNERVWVNKSQSNEVNTYINERLTGGTAKNNAVWVSNHNNSETTTVSGHDEKMAVKGPNAKNYETYKAVKALRMDSLTNDDLVQITK